MGLLDSFFGEPASSQSSQRTFIDPSQRSLFTNQLFPFIRQFAGTQGDVNDPTSFFNPLQLQGQQAALQNAQQFNQQFTQPGLQTAQNLMAGANINDNPFVQQAIQATLNPFSRAFADNLRNIRGTAVGVGQVGSSGEQQAQQDAIRTFTQGAGDAISRLALGAQQQGQSAALGGLGALQGLGQMSFIPSQIQQQIGGLQQDAPFRFGSQLSSLIGRPTILSEGSSFSRGPQQGFGDLFASGLGFYDYFTGR